MYLPIAHYINLESGCQICCCLKQPDHSKFPEWYIHFLARNTQQFNQKLVPVLCTYVEQQLKYFLFFFFKSLNFQSINIQIKIFSPPIELLFFCNEGRGRGGDVCKRKLILGKCQVLLVAYNRCSKYFIEEKEKKRKGGYWFRS